MQQGLYSCTLLLRIHCRVTCVYSSYAWRVPGNRCSRNCTLTHPRKWLLANRPACIYVLGPIALSRWFAVSRSCLQSPRTQVLVAHHFSPYFCSSRYSQTCFHIPMLNQCPGECCMTVTTTWVRYLCACDDVIFLGSGPDFRLIWFSTLQALHTHN